MAAPETAGRFPLPARQENVLLYVLAAIQFTHILDFMIVMPLGPRLMEIFRITPSQFGLIVSTYTFSAGLFGLVAAWFLDRFDRKAALLCLYSGFALGTLACALAPSYAFLVAARFLAGGFGGVTSAVILAVIGDAIPPQRRGAAMGTLFSSFSLASIAGVPAGLFLANHLGWHAPFFLLAGLSAAIAVMAANVLPSMRDHQARVKEKPWEEMKVILGRANHWRAFALTVFMTMAGFLIVPYLSPSLVANVGLTNEQLPLIYLCGGAVTFFSMRWFGKISDRLGLLRVFTALSVIAVFPILIISHLPPVPLWTALLCTTCFMVFISGRFIPGMAMVTNSVQAQLRGGFMSLNSAMQQFASGLASLIAGAVITGGSGARLEHYGTVGLIGGGCVVVSILLARRLKAA
ncbi:MAG TPA: MFS transporter [Fibrobacteria bacterium]|nr:MFS transporter [Fibrobacteria bacterium]